MPRSVDFCNQKPMIRSNVFFLKSPLGTNKVPYVCGSQQQLYSLQFQHLRFKEKIMFFLTLLLNPFWIIKSNKYSVDYVISFHLLFYFFSIVTVYLRFWQPCFLKPVAQLRI